MDSLDSSVIEAIDAYMKDSTPLSIGYETHGIYAFADICHEWFDKENLQRLVHIKKECCQYSKRKEYEYRKALEEKSRHYFDNIGKHRFVWSHSLHSGHYLNSYKSHVERSCMKYFEKYAKEHGLQWMISEYGSVENAILNTASFIELWNKYVIYFDERRKEFLEKMEVDIQKNKEISIKKTPQSHGGVANLLKVLTQTMQKQGADITSIAKVQYAVCVQAGIYIPDEFISDVAVSMNIEGNL